MPGASFILLPKSVCSLHHHFITSDSTNSQHVQNNGYQWQTKCPTNTEQISVALQCKIESNKGNIITYQQQTIEAVSYTHLDVYKRQDLPLPDTPVTQINLPNGNSTSTFFRLFPFAPFSQIDFPFPFLRLTGISIFIFPFRYCEVIVSVLSISDGVPEKTTSPPRRPAFGPISDSYTHLDVYKRQPPACLPGL